MNRDASRIAVGCLLLYLLLAHVAGPAALAQPPVGGQRSLSGRALEWPSWEDWRRLVLLQEYNTRVVIIGVTLYGCAAGMVGSFTLLRKRALMGDALSHATLPGIGLTFMLVTMLGGNGKSLPLLLLGATCSGLLGLGAILVIRNATRLKEDTALGAVLSVFFGGGIALLNVAFRMKEGRAAGLESFIYGKTASMGAQDVQLIAAAALVCIGACLLLFKEFKLLCFDEAFAGSRGFPTLRLDVLLMALVVTVCIIGLQAVGLILVIALLIIPAAAARFWTESMWKMFVIAGVLGALGGMVGAGVSALFSRLPSGAMIVLVCTTLFLVSLVFGSARGLLARWLRRRRLNRTVDRQHVLRAMYELWEASLGAEPTGSNTAGPAAVVPMKDLLAKRSWSPRRLRRALRRAVRDHLMVQLGDEVRLTERGKIEAARLTRQHRLWELYLITHAEIAPSRVDREADAIEHVLEPEVVAELEALLDETYPTVPRSPHALGGGTQRTPVSHGSEGG